MPTLFQTAGPLIAGFLYAVATYLFRRAALNGLRMGHQMLFAGGGITIVGVPFLLAAGVPETPALLAALAGALSFGSGTLLSLLAVHAGDASVQTPLMGTKIPWVILLTVVLFDQSVGVEVWIAAVLVVIAVFAIGFTRSAREHVSVRAVTLALLAGLAYALLDALLGSGRYGGIDSGFFAVTVVGSGVLAMAIGVGTLARRPVRLSRAAWPPLLAGTLFFMVQFTIEAGVISQFGNAPQANILYSTRGLWSVVLAWLVSHGGRTVRPPRRVFLQRMAGAIILVIAVALAL